MSHLWINGQFVDKAEAKVSPFDHGFLFGDGVWEPLRVFEGQILFLEHHLELFFSAAESARISIPYSQSEMASAIESTLRANNRESGYVRIIASRGAGTLGPDPRKIDPNVLVIAEEYQPFPMALYEHGLHAITYTAPVPQFRFLGQPHLVAAKRRALECGCLEAIFIQPNGDLSGSTEGLVFIVRDGAIVVAGDQLSEATASAVATMAAEAEYEVAGRAIDRDDLLAADEVLIAGTSCGVIGIVRIDDRKIGSGIQGPISKTLRNRYQTLTRRG